MLTAPSTREEATHELLAISRNQAPLATGLAFHASPKQNITFIDWGGGKKLYMGREQA